MYASDAVPVTNSAHVVGIIRSGGVRVAKQQVKIKKEAAAIRSWQNDNYTDTLYRRTSPQDQSRAS